MAAGCPIPSQIGTVRAQGDALRLCQSISKVLRLSTPLKISLSAKAIQHMTQRGKGPIETTRENIINKLRNVIVSRLVVVKSVPGQLEVDRIDRGKTPRQIL